MPADIDLATLGANANYMDPIKPTPGVGVADYGRSAVAGGYGVVGGIASGIDYLADSDDDSVLKSVRKWAEHGIKDTIEGMTPDAKAALNAGFLPGGEKSIWGGDVNVAHALGLKVANASPSLLASIIPGGIVAKAAQGVGLAAGSAALAGTAAAGVTNATMAAGQVFDDIENQVLDAKDAELIRNSPLYAYLRKDRGASETLAKKVVVEAAAGNKPLLAAAVGFAAEQFGAAAMTAKRAVGEAGEGMLKGAAKGFKEEAATEAVQNATQEGLTQRGQIEAGTQAGFDWHKFAEQAVQGGVVGGMLGGMVGAAHGTAGGKVAGAAVYEPGRAQHDPIVDEVAGTGAAVTDAGKGARETGGKLDQRPTPALDPAIAAATGAAEPVVLQNNGLSDFMPANEFDADPDHEPGMPAPSASAPHLPEPPAEQPPEPVAAAQVPAQPQPSSVEQPREAAQVPPGRGIGGSDLLVQPAEPPAAVAPPQVTQAAPENSPSVGGQEIDLASLVGSDAAEVPAGRRVGENGGVENDARTVVEAAEPSDAARAGKPAAVRSYAAGLVKAAKAAGVKLDADDAHAMHLRQAVKVATGKGGEAAMHAFLSEDMLLRDDAFLRDFTAAPPAAPHAANPPPVTAVERGPSQPANPPPGAETARAETSPMTADRAGRPAEPTPAQAKAGNYLMGRASALGFDVSVETAKGGTRSGTDPDGKEWSVRMPADYGYLRGTKGVDGDHLDVYLGPNASKDGPVYVIDQNDLDGSFDEHKSMVGFRSRAEAVRAYKAAFSDGKGAQRIGSVVEMSPADFRAWAVSEPKGPAVAPGAETKAKGIERKVAERKAAVVPGTTDRATGERTSPAEAKPKSKAAQQREKVAQQRSDLAAYFTPGETVESYGGGRDRVVSFEPETGTVRVQGVDADGKVVGRERTHSTMPSPAVVRRVLDARRAQAPMPMRAKRTETPREVERRLELSREDAEPEILPTNAVTSPRTGASTPILSSSTLGAALATIDHTKAGGTSAQINPFVARKLAQLVADVPVHVVSDEGMVALTRDLAGQGSFPAEVAGYYDPPSHSIVLRLSDANKGTSHAELSHLLVHEGLHAAFMQTIETTPAAKQLIRHLMREVSDHLGSGAADYYGMLNPHEFVSEAFSSRQFQDLLSTIPVSGTYSQLPARNAWGLFIAAVRKFLHLGEASTSALDASLRIGAVLTDLRTAKGEPSTARGTLAPAAVGSDALKAGLGDAWETGKSVAGNYLSRNAARLKTLDQLRQGSVFRKLFPAPGGGDHFDNAVRAIEAQHTFAKDQERAGQGHAQAFVELQRRSPDVAREFAVLGQDARMANVILLPGTPTEAEMRAANGHLYGSDTAGGWQSRAKHVELQRRFSKLPADAQRQFLDVVAWFRATQEEQVSDFARNMISGLAPAMPAAQREILVKRTLAGTLREEDRAAIGNDALYNALAGAREFKLQSGTYVPLSRFGDYVVRVRDRVRDTMGGREVSPGVVAFSGTDRQARAAAKAFAEKTDLTVKRVVKRYFDPQTGEALKYADADRDSRVEYHVAVQTEGLYNYGSEVEAAAAEKRMRDSRAHSEVKGYERIKDYESRGDLTHSQLSALLSSVEKRDDLLPGQKELLRTAMAQAAIRLQSGNRISQHSLPSQMWAGASTDFARTVLSYARAQAAALAKGRYMPAVRDSLRAMEEQVREFGHDKSQVRHIMYEELKARVDGADTSAKGAPKALRYLLSATMLGKLASPAYSVVNATDPLLKALPVMAARHGAIRATVEMAAAYRDIGFHRSVGEGAANTFKAARRVMETTIDASDPVASIKRRLAQVKGGVELNRMIDVLAARHALGDDVAFELASAVQQGDGPVGHALAKTDRIFRAMPAAIEAVNRAGTAVTAYRLARADGMDVQAATDHAHDVIKATQFDYSTHNTPPVFSKTYLKPLLQFKKYAQGVNHLYMSAIYRAFKADSKAERRIAMREFGNLAATHALFAGVFGIPGMEAVKAGAMLSAALGLGGGSADLERKVKRALEASVGKTWADVVTDGAVGTATGLDLKGRLGAGETMLFGEPRKYQKTDMLAYAMQMLAGAPGGTLMDIGSGIGDIWDGDYLKGAGKIVPVKVLGDTAKALDQLGEKMGPGEAAVRAFGLTPKRVADRREEKADKAADTAASFAERDELRRRFNAATSAGKRARVKNDIVAWNRTAPANRRLSIPALEKKWRENHEAAMQ